MVVRVFNQLFYCEKVFNSSVLRERMNGGAGREGVGVEGRLMGYNGGARPSRAD